MISKVVLTIVGFVLAVGAVACGIFVMREDRETTPHKELRRRRWRRLYVGLLLVVVVGSSLASSLALWYYVTHPDNSRVRIPEGFVLEKSRQVAWEGMMYEGPVKLVRLRCPFAPAEALRKWRPATDHRSGDPQKPDEYELQFRADLPWSLRTGLCSPDDINSGMCIRSGDDDILFAWPVPEGSVVEIIYVIKF